MMKVVCIGVLAIVMLLLVGIPATAEDAASGTGVGSVSYGMDEYLICSTIASGGSTVPEGCTAGEGDQLMQTDQPEDVEDDTSISDEESAEHIVIELAVDRVTRVSLRSNGNEGNDDSYSPSNSANGRYVAFASEATNLVAGDTNGVRDIFVHDRVTKKTTRVSVRSNGDEGNGLSNNPFISSSGRYVAFESDATNLVRGDANGVRDIFVHDRETKKTTLVSIRSNGDQGNEISRKPSISSDGRYVAFESFAKNLVAGDSNNWPDIFVHDRTTGKTVRVSVKSDGTQGNGGSFNAKITPDAKYVGFDSHASNLVKGDWNGAYDVFMHNMNTGSTFRISVRSNGKEGNDDSYSPSISSDGKYIAFRSEATNLVTGDTNGAFDIFVRDRNAGRTTRVSVRSNGNEGNGDSHCPAISADGMFVAFESEATNLVAGDTNTVRDVFLHKLENGRTIRVSVNASGTQGNSFSYDPSISKEGNLVMFESDSSNLLNSDTNGERDIFVARIS